MNLLASFIKRDIGFLSLSAMMLRRCHPASCDENPGIEHITRVRQAPQETVLSAETVMWTVAPLGWRVPRLAGLSAARAASANQRPPLCATRTPLRRCSFNRHITEDGRSVTTKWRERKNFDYRIKRNRSPLRRETKLNVIANYYLLQFLLLTSHIFSLSFFYFLENEG